MERDIASANENAEQARAQAAAARALASGADHDVADVRQQLRAHTQTLNALRQTQLDHYREFTDFRTETQANFAKINENFAKVNENFATVNANFTKIESTLAAFAVGQMHITRLIEGLAGK
ncbi:hypothetical protein [Labedaea rhizosphaerae]|uniref:Uncharacterized protein n=1 Tax=Labedaea rhizosphaerae TaxID=598644 RepID=A0A4R6S9L4_LABRH|nr:hypothetical protein [Labedaea rhizosphaerae]TDP96154.1 hypothetical protein EV186_104136 [Labedaea rhizosphaerae]